MRNTLKNNNYDQLDRKNDHDAVSEKDDQIMDIDIEEDEKCPSNIDINE